MDDTEFPLNIEAVRKAVFEIVEASMVCRDGMRSHFLYKSEDDKNLRYYYVGCEFLYFYLHILSRQCSKQYGYDTRDTIQAYLGSSISEVMVSMWPENLIDKIRAEFFDHLNGAEEDYSNCTEGISDSDKDLSGNSLASMVSRNVATMCGVPLNIEARQDALSLALKALEQLNIDDLLRKMLNKPDHEI
jgi:hypothetical protein